MAAFSPSWASEITNFTPRRPRRVSLRKNSVQNVSASDGPNIHAKDFSPAVTVDADRDNDGDGDDAASLPHLHISGVQPDIGPVAFQRTGQEGLNSLVDLAAQAADLALGDATHTHGLNQIIDGTCRNALDIGFLDYRGQRLFGHPTR